MKITVNHALSKGDAFSRIKNLLAEIKEEHGDKVTDIEEEWSDYSGQFSWKILGSRVNAHLLVENDHVVFKGKLPLAALPFKGLVEDTIRKKADKLLS